MTHPAAPAIVRRLIGRRAFLGGAAGLVAGTSLLGTGALAQEPAQGGHLVLGLGGGASTDSLDPALASGSVMFVINQSWGDTIVESHPETGEAIPNLAESWEASPDATEWTFRLRPGIRFHDGTEMTVADVVETLRRHAEEGSQSGALGLLTSFTGIEDRGGDLVITLDTGNADLPLILTDYHLVVQPGGGRADPTAPMGTGPYRLTEFQAGVRAAFERNEDDWRDDRGHVASAEIIVINDATARVAALGSGRVQLIDSVNPSTVPLLSRVAGTQILQTRGKGFYSFLMHCDTAPFDNNDLRLALKFAIDRQGILDTVLAGYGTIGNDIPVNEAYALFPEGIPQREFDPDQARFHYEASGHSGPITLRTSDAAFSGAVDAAVLFQQTAAQAGITLDIVREPADGYWSNVWNVQPFCASYWGGRPTQDSRYSTSYLSSAEWNDTRWMVPEFDAKLLEARAELDDARRAELYREMAVMLHEQGGLILPVFNDYVNAAAPSLQGYVHDIGNDLSNGRVMSRVWLQG
jgi:peptide/nickel transport system substrate-binding protein